MVVKGLGKPREPRTPGSMTTTRLPLRLTQVLSEMMGSSTKKTRRLLIAGRTGEAHGREGGLTRLGSPRPMTPQPIGTSAMRSSSRSSWQVSYFSIDQVWM